MVVVSLEGHPLRPACCGLQLAGSGIQPIFFIHHSPRRGRQHEKKLVRWFLGWEGTFLYI
jgi:hypothetical protein